MGWWNSLWGSKTNYDDPLRNLDPKLREYLQKESPVKYPSQPAAKPDSQTKPTPAPAQQTKVEDDPGKPKVPKESLYQDGRYSHLWKTYQPLVEIEAATKTDQEKILDVLDAFKDRKALVGKAALENCALEQMEWRECMTNPTFAERITLCRDKMKKFERCYMMQTRLLKSLGYLSVYGRSPEIEEQVQLHADKIYHQLRAQEAEIEKAKEEGQETPKFGSIIPKKPLSATGASQRELTEQEQETLKAKLAKVKPEDREAEEESIKADMRAQDNFQKELKGIIGHSDAERQRRKEEGEATLVDQLVAVLKFGGGGSEGGDTKK